jgi:isoleucyl-tRNA synthetase
MEQALTEHAGQIATEVLAVSLHAGTPGDGPGIEGPGGSRFWLARAGG